MTYFPSEILAFPTPAYSIRTKLLNKALDEYHELERTQDNFSTQAVSSTQRIRKGKKIEPLA